MKFENNFSKHLVTLLMLIPLFVFSQKEYFPTNSGVKVVNETYKAFVNATIVVNSEKTIENGTIIFRDGKIINVGKGIKMPKNTIVINKKDKLISIDSFNDPRSYMVGKKFLELKINPNPKDIVSTKIDLKNFLREIK